MLKGTHGTSQSRAESILSAQCFTSSTEGRAGAGIYFWYYAVSEKAAYITAEQWWQFAFSKRVYKIDYDQSCAVLQVKIDKEKSNFLDLTEDLYREKLIELANEQGCTTREQANALITFLIDKVEQRAQHKYTLVKLMVPMPSSRGSEAMLKLSTLFSTAPALIVRHEKHELITDIKLMEKPRG